MSEDRITQRTVTVVMGIIALLAFVFSFGNVWALALRLGVPAPIAPLIAPMVDLSVVGLLVALRYLSLRGVPPEQMKAATRLMHVSGLLTLALNIAEPVVAGHYGRAAIDAVAPLLLLGWGAVGPQLLRSFHTVATAVAEPAPATETEAVQEPAPASGKPAPVISTAPPVTPEPTPPPVAPLTVPVPAPAAPAVKVPEPLLTEARSIAASHQAEHGETITPAQLKIRLGIGLPMATALHSAL
ncbi:DUF2637 domain-containing protein [Streptomyces sp. S.PB5]|uniref:DUF2637 domain-containing protein n=1 Tax=Streptomyces sp. S.PB5 TaxID=3020844 RepID=UPI0025B04A9F|nr:DUF2637 domain-containing protein [Streptomyces sp. S.PB5]MDN3027023.1 DUF2637 domain-containing protein [Streptomyces sp. S.PB5]